MINREGIQVEQKCLIIVYSYHHRNTEKIANEFADVLDAEVTTPADVKLESLDQYALIGFGAGIDSGKHYKELLDIVDRLPQVNEKNSFIFSTSAVQGDEKVGKDHELLREKLVSKGYIVVGEFSSKGYNTNSFLKYIGGMNKGRPNCEDLECAREFAKSLIKHSK